MRIVSDGWFRIIPSGEHKTRGWLKRRANKETRRLGKALVSEGMTS